MGDQGLPSGTAQEEESGPSREAELVQETGVVVIANVCTVKK